MVKCTECKKEITSGKKHKVLDDKNKKVTLCNKCYKKVEFVDEKKNWGPLPVKLKSVSILLIAAAFVYGLSDGSLFVPIFGILSYFCGKRCYWWAKEIKENELVAYAIGFFLILVGVFGYYLFYKQKKGA